MLKISDFDLRQLRVFKAVADCGGFSAAEASLNMTLSAISLQMAELEGRVGLRLCERGRGGFRLTDAGRRLYDSVEKLIASVEDFHVDIGAIHGRISGRLSIGTVDNTISNPGGRLAAALRAVRERDSDLSITLEIGSASQIEDAVQSGRLDVGIGPFRGAVASLSYEHLYTESLQLYCGRGHAFFDGPPSTFDPSAVTGIDYVTRGYFRELKELPELENFRLAAVANNMEGVAMLVLSGKLVGFLPRHYAAYWIERDLMRVLFEQSLEHRVEFNVISRRDQKVTERLRLFLRALREPGARN
ncbi:MULTISPECIES: LysR family transcriptional regulator [Paraburkholderia]|uniref:DNA-binding transcriptional LysR family regulator n=1 Tax=Paraburkholderia tropica TaxID=92647 RepID=A0A1A5XD50_9BURK|nr:LysR family transcriptional regulator [Paraburkholderia tropica]MBB2981934.1 DNA-binding transcriptional LysR family regulator [Paraburkholderia tropica]MBB3003532.1 DNA-binding transcriptional LysR family regulator [Paraburkholderia tropica]MBB6322558.1 DNA-binding transcriptional LysR family regulator [Paraburkholderia tropica]MDE1144049.1 LysR family transcriptional regulator [Paraburkholderia tropica]OBR51254.1 LysR family transcriptional regulator [Paraburkholderia tropica]